MAQQSRLKLVGNFQLKEEAFPLPPENDREDIHGRRIDSPKTETDKLFDRVAALLRLQGMRLEMMQGEAVLTHTWNGQTFNAPDKESALIMLCLAGAWSNAQEKR